jgi:RNA polymerase sigma-70 factor (ECF subfamily)
MTQPHSGVAQFVADEELVAHVAAGSVDAFAELYDRYCARAYGLALSVCRDHGRAQEAVQEGFLAIWKMRAAYDPAKGSVAAWLLTVVRYRSIDLMRHSRVDATGWASDPHLSTWVTADDACEQAISHETADHLRTLLGALPDAQREVILLAFYGGLSHTEIAARLDLPPGTVKGRMRLGLQRLHVGFQSTPASAQAA